MLAHLDVLLVASMEMNGWIGTSETFSEGACVGAWSWGTEDEWIGTSEMFSEEGGGGESAGRLARQGWPEVV